MYLSNQTALVCTGDGQRFSARGDGWTSVLAAISEQVGEARWRGGLQVLLSGGLARPFVQAAVDGIDTRDEALQVAAASAPEATALDAPCAVWIDGWIPGKACLAAAVEQRLLDGLRAFARDRSVSLRSVRPWWDATLNDAGSRADDSRMLALEDEDALLLLIASDDGVEVGEVFCYSPRPEAKQRLATESRIALAVGMGTVDVARALWVVTPLDEAANGSELGRVVWLEATGP